MGLEYGFLGKEKSERKANLIQDMKQFCLNIIQSFSGKGVLETQDMRERSKNSLIIDKGVFVFNLIVALC